MSTESTDFTRLQILFKRVGTLPPLSTTVMELIRRIDTDEASAIDLERIISSDPSLTSNFLRVAANSGQSGVGSQATTIRNALMRLGQRTVRCLAVSLAVKEMIAERGLPASFKPVLYARHCLTVAFVARYLFARKQRHAPFDTQWSADEIFAAGLLHDLGIGLLAQVSPDIFSRVSSYARRMGQSVNEAFESIYGQHASVLGADAAEAWQLPQIFVDTLRYQLAPWEFEHEYIPLCCLNYANYIAERFGETSCDWEITPAIMPEVEVEVGLQEEEMESLKEVLERHIEAYIGDQYTQVTHQKPA